MTDYTNKSQVSPEQEQTEGFNLLALWRIVMLNWYWMLLSAFVCLGCAYAYLRYTPSVYSVSAKLLIKDEDNKKRIGNNLSLADMGIISNSNGFDNELEILTSTTIAEDAVKQLKLYARYFIKGRLTTRETYKDSPILVDMDDETLNELEVGIKMTITPKGKGIHVITEFPDKEDPKHPIIKEQDIASLPGVVETKHGTIVLTKNKSEEAKKLETQLTATITPIKMMAAGYAKKLNAQATSKTTTIAALSINDTQVDRALDYLNQLVISYNTDANADKNEVAEKTRDFIESRIQVIGSELDETENKLENYKKENELINIANDATNSLTGTTDYQKELVEIETQITLVKGLIDYVSTPANQNQVIPANLGLKDATVNQDIKTYNEGVLLYNRLSRTGAEANPNLKKVQEKTADMREAILQSLNSVYANLLVQKKSINNQYSLYESRIRNTPKHERTLMGIGRQQEIKSGLYLMLLQKREENFISLNSTATKAKVIDEPRFEGKVSPKSNIILLFGLVLGLCIPIGIIYLIDLLRFRIEGHEDVEKLSQIPILCDVPLSRFRKGEVDRDIVVLENTNNSMEETFRGLRTNLRFIMKESEKVILCTSTTPGEGKTFIATNLAMSFALLGKKVLLIGLDIRKPRLVNLFKLPADKRGITNFLSTETAGFDLLEEQIHRGVINKNLDVMPAGIIPPNPGELISRPRLDEAINYLRTQYDTIIIDTPPVGLVSDTLEIGRVADVSLYVCRADFSPKANIALANNLSSQNKLPKLNLVVNGIDMKKKKYGYYYGYGKYGKYSKYGNYGHYGHYGIYGNYSSDASGHGRSHTEK